jgi:probable rRNA maturation factor
MPVLVRHEGRKSQASAKACARVKLLASRMLRVLDLADAQLSILLCDDALMRRLNREHRAIDRTTDVLSFAMHEGRELVSVQPLLGDIAISLPTIARQAREHGVTADRELCLMLAHGLLHLLGFDHVTRRQERHMTARSHMLMAAALAPPKPVEKQLRPVVKKPAATRRRPRVQTKS